MSHENLNQELDALRENLPSAIEGAAGESSLPTKSASQYYSIETAKRIIDLYSQGRSLAWISRSQSEMPCYSTLLRWSKEHPEFASLLRSVREARALHFEDAAIESAEQATGKDADRLKFEAYKWGAEVNDPTVYGKRVNSQVEQTGKVILQVVTGFGPPNPWQTPPKLKEDGTIDKEASIVNVQVERSETVGGDQATAAAPGSLEEHRSSDVVRGSVSDLEHGVQALPDQQGHPSPDGSAQGA